MPDVTSEFMVLGDTIIIAGLTCQTILARVDARIARTPPGPERNNLLAFRRQLAQKIVDYGP